MKSKMLVAAILTVTASANAYAAGKLPKDAKPLSEAEMTAIYSGNTISWSPGYGYFKPDGTFIGVWKDVSFGKGTWAIHGNEICYSAVWKDKKSTLSEEYCWKLYLAGKKQWVEESKNAEHQGAIHPNNKKVIKGDKASTAAAAVEAKLK